MKNFLKSNSAFTLIFSIVLSLSVGLITAFLTKNSSSVYQSLVKPPLSPPAYVFPIVWTILYTLMGISAFLIYTSFFPYKYSALKIYFLQLLLTFIWSVVFFNMNQYLLAFFILILLWICIFAMILAFSKINKTAAKLQIPYLLWVTFAGYLNLAIYFLSI